MPLDILHATPQHNYISKIKLPESGTYWLKDSEAREAIAKLEGGSYFLGVSVTPIYDGLDDPRIFLSDATDAEPVYATNGNMAIYGHAEFVWGGTPITPEQPISVGKWIEFGDLSMLGHMAYKDDVILNKGNGDRVLGADTTITTSDSQVVFESHTSDEVLGGDTTFTVVQPEITVIPTMQHLQAISHDTQLSTLQSAAVSGYDAVQSIQFVRNIEIKREQNLVTTTIVATDGVQNVSKVENTTKHLATTHIPNVTDLGTASTWNFKMGSGTDDSETLVISGVNSTTPTYGDLITAATGKLAASDDSGDELVDSITIRNYDVARMSPNTVTVATGQLAQDGAGAAVVSNVVISETHDAVIDLGAPTTFEALTDVDVSKEPTTDLIFTEDAVREGIVDLTTGITSSTASEVSVTADRNDRVNPLTELGGATAKAQTITVHHDDDVDVAKYNDLSLTIVERGE